MYVELELDLPLVVILSQQVAQKPMPRGEVGARALRVRLVAKEGAWASAGVQGAWLSGLCSSTGDDS